MQFFILKPLLQLKLSEAELHIFVRMYIAGNFNMWTKGKNKNFISNLYPPPLSPHIPTNIWIKISKIW